MGWFWADVTPSPASLPRAAGRPTRGREPPPGCPIHNSPSAKYSSIPVPPASPPGKESATTTPSYISKLNPLNYMPSDLANERQTSRQSVALPLERESSTIPRGDGLGTWEYPSPQQMYNAMLRKGYADTPAEHVESMVAVHNFLNEGAWEEIREWERRFSGGLARGWQVSLLGEEGATRQGILDEVRGRPFAEPKLLKFVGRPDEPTPKARMLGFMSRIYPSQFPDNPPFDRHDWFVERQFQDPAGRSDVVVQQERRYVIDYYSGPPEPTGEPVFYLDVRPAVDGPKAAAERLMRWAGDVWFRASGGSARRNVE